MPPSSAMVPTAFRTLPALPVSPSTRSVPVGRSLTFNTVSGWVPLAVYTCSPKGRRMLTVISWPTSARVVVQEA